MIWDNKSGFNILRSFCRVKVTFAMLELILTHFPERYNDCSMNRYLIIFITGPDHMFIVPSI
jgi:hypothetical protein